MDHHQLYTIDEVDEIDTPYENEQGDVLAVAASGSSSTTLDPSSGAMSTNSSVDDDEWIDDDYDALSQQFKKPFRSLANTHMPPPKETDHGRDDDDLDEDDLDINFDFDEAVFEDMISLPLLAPDECSTPSVNFQIPNTRLLRRKWWELRRSTQAWPPLRTVDESLARNEGNRGQDDGSYIDDPGDYVVVDGEEEDDNEQLTDSCLNLIRHLDDVMSPTVEAPGARRGEELEIQDTDNFRDKISNWLLLDSKHKAQR
ncbi:hypothetical protein TARUN_4539 [Trichoderma arundinaceum]|uniref:Uncharacterized protein n=1 Tax=Trichoderma arundinaceum TaxID=490622 RepID=A0A395NNN0_TRIAR|nr:hypothetical protein TARUN_4539 [Trichoderma arundinaceum]